MITFKPTKSKCKMIKSWKNFVNTFSKNKKNLMDFNNLRKLSTNKTVILGHYCKKVQRKISSSIQRKSWKTMQQRERCLREQAINQFLRIMLIIPPINLPTHRFNKDNMKILIIWETQSQLKRFIISLKNFQMTTSKKNKYRIRWGYCFQNNFRICQFQTMVNTYNNASNDKIRI